MQDNIANDIKRSLNKKKSKINFAKSNDKKFQSDNNFLSNLVIDLLKKDID